MSRILNIFSRGVFAIIVGVRLNTGIALLHPLLPFNALVNNKNSPFTNMGTSVGR